MPKAPSKKKAAEGKTTDVVVADPKVKGKAAEAAAGLNLTSILLHPNDFTEPKYH